MGKKRKKFLRLKRQRETAKMEQLKKFTYRKKQFSPENWFGMFFNFPAETWKEGPKYEIIQRNNAKGAANETIIWAVSVHKYSVRRAKKCAQKKKIVF